MKIKTFLLFTAIFACIIVYSFFAVRKESGAEFAVSIDMGKPFSIECYVAVNGACGVNETSFTENCFWVDGKLYKVDSIKFDYDPEDFIQPWRISSYDGKLDLVFTPQGTMDENNNFILMASAFNQMFGQYQGTLRLDERETIAVDGLYGFTEEHYSKW